MSALAFAVSDSTTMTRRVLKHTMRNPSTLLMSIMLPLIILLLLNYGIGGALNTGDIKYIDYLIPGIIMMGAGYSASATAVAVSSDMNEGIIDRFRTLSISRGSILIGHVAGNTLRTAVGIAVVVLAGLGMGFRPAGGAASLLEAAGLVVLLLFTVSWLATAIGLAAQNTSSAASVASLISMLPFLSGAFAPTDTMPGWLRTFTENQPMTHIIDALRGLMMDTPVGSHGWISVVWCAGITVFGYLWAKSVFGKKTVR
ncbi:ABC transporter permease [Actinomadura latina]|uniref:Transport permease protein n=1 Tax=Actinomadura latina TaxID=163603 RepID=A0A846ZFB4_9ACTN|nr:ABC transporter permease [Actinomadura latina]NKZ08786.1 ABC transporter permease [Actinomadura latina]